MTRAVFLSCLLLLFLGAVHGQVQKCNSTITFSIRVDAANCNSDQQPTSQQAAITTSLEKNQVTVQSVNCSNNGSDMVLLYTMTSESNVDALDFLQAVSYQVQFGKYPWPDGTAVNQKHNIGGAAKITATCTYDPAATLAPPVTIPTVKPTEKSSEVLANKIVLFTFLGLVLAFLLIAIIVVAIFYCKLYQKVKIYKWATYRPEFYQFTF